MLLLHNSEFTTACSLLQGAKSIPETLCGMYLQYEVDLTVLPHLASFEFVHVFRILAVYESVLKLLSVSHNSFIFYRGRYLVHHVVFFSVWVW